MGHRVRPQQRHGAQHQHPHPKLVEQPGKQPPGDAGADRQGVCLRQGRPMRRLPPDLASLRRQRRRVQSVQVGSGVQTGKGLPRRPQPAADLLHPVQGRPLPAHFRKAPVQHGGKLQPSGGQFFQFFNGHAQPPQQLDLLQSGQVLLAVLPVAVFRPGRAQQSLRLVIPDVGPGHAGPLLHLLAGQKTTSSFFSVHCKAT